MLVIRAVIYKMLVRIANRKTLIRLLLQKHPDLGLHCLSRPFYQTISVVNFRTFNSRDFGCIVLSELTFSRLVLDLFRAPPTNVGRALLFSAHPSVRQLSWSL